MGPIQADVLAVVCIFMSVFDWFTVYSYPVLQACVPRLMTYSYLYIDGSRVSH